MIPRLNTRNEQNLATLISCPKEGEHPYTLFLGAGASVTSGIPTAQGMIEKWRRQLYEQHSSPQQQSSSAIDYTAWRKDVYEADILPDIHQQGETEYSALFRHFHPLPSQRQMYLEELIDRARPTWGYLYLAGLISKGRFNRVLTTNFDDLLHDALFRYFDVKSVVCAFDSAVTSVRINSKRPKIIKLHGDYLYDNLRNIRDEVKQLGANIKEKLLEICKDSGLIVVGYSGNDDSIMEPLLTCSRKPGYLPMGIHFCVVRGPDGESIAPPRIDALRRNYSEKVHLYSITDFDCLMEVIFYKCCSQADLPPILIDPSKRNLALEFKDAVDRGRTYTMSANMERDLAYFLTKAETFDPGPHHFVSHADMEQKLGNRAIRENGDLESAEQAYKKGFELLGRYFEKCSGVNGEPGPFELFVMAWRRKSGLNVGMAELEWLRKSDTWKKYFIETIIAVQKGIDFCDSHLGQQLDDSLRRQFQYNGICAYALKAKFDHLSSEEMEAARHYYTQLEELDPDLQDVRDLERECGFEELKT